MQTLILTTLANTNAENSNTNPNAENSSTNPNAVNPQTLMMQTLTQTLMFSNQTTLQEKMDKCMGGDIEDTFDLATYEVRMLAHDIVVAQLLKEAADLHNSSISGSSSLPLTSSSDDSLSLLKGMESLHVISAEETNLAPVVVA